MAESGAAEDITEWLAQLAGDGLQRHGAGAGTGASTGTPVDALFAALYAELKKLKTVIEKVNNGEKVFILLDDT